MNNDILTADQWRSLQAMADRIIPADDYPCAWDAGVGGFLSQILTKRPDFIETYRLGLTSLDSESSSVYELPFSALAPDEQDHLLSAIDSGSVRSVWSTNPRYFFSLVAEQVMEGFYADPGNGGNIGGVSWEMIGFKVTA